MVNYSLISCESRGPRPRVVWDATYGCKMSEMQIISCRFMTARGCDY